MGQQLPASRIGSTPSSHVTAAQSAPVHAHTGQHSPGGTTKLPCSQGGGASQITELQFETAPVVELELLERTARPPEPSVPEPPVPEPPVPLPPALAPPSLPTVEPPQPTINTEAISTEAIRPARAVLTAGISRMVRQVPDSSCMTKD